MKKLIATIFNRNFIIVLLLLLQIAFMGFTIWKARENYLLVSASITFLNIVLIIYIINKNENPAYRIAWIVAIDIMPLFAGLAYLFIQMQFTKKIAVKLQNRSIEYSKNFLFQNSEVLHEIELISPKTANLAHYINEFGPYPIYSKTNVEYFSLGELQFEALISELKKANHFIFLEFFIIAKGHMFDTLTDILIEKAKSGVEVRFMYDGIGAQINDPISNKTFKKLSESGIKLKCFNTFTPFLSTLQNNRDHRKIVVIDGNVAFTGGINIADEYINLKERFGHWKDTGIMLRGEAVWNYTVMFLQLWEINEVKVSNYEEFIPQYQVKGDYIADGFVQPYSDTPMDNENVGELIYMDIINNAEKYVYITTPYLILDNEFLTALQFAAKKGVDVRIITPHIPDKWYVYMIAWRYYPKLIEAGVKIYEYTPGFIHSKSFVADDNTAVIGTINLDYRSFYLHYECACLLYNNSAVFDIKNDFIETMNISQQITMEDCKKQSLRHKIAGGILNIFAPLL